ncbi:glycosyltransferase [Azonexus sp. R2A61]|uniref:glycosyltransferase n=1 Tax=Azonexus sp. R2A61 TaxID=2744443 RepID=UPI001F185FF5|nr:glycosyltransferase [Azonexus sp. R2A61]
MNIRHLIITRFNVASPGREAAIRLKRGWLDERFILFEDICLPSVKAQSNQCFEWIIFFDVETPADYKEKISELTKVYPFKPVYTDSFDMRVLGPQIVRDCEPADFLLTSRLDSDDILADDYVARVQDVALSGKGKFVINFDQGAILQLNGSKQALYEYWDHSNPFSSMVEPFGLDAVTIWGVQHTELSQLGQVQHISGTPMWLQVVHGGNVSNRVRGTRVRINAYDDRFGYLRNFSCKVRENAFEFGLDRYFFGNVRLAKEFARKILKHLYRFIFK